MIIRFNNFWEYGNFEALVNLKELCKCEGKREETINSKGKLVKVVSYSKPKLRKLFKLIVLCTYDDYELEKIQLYLDENSKSYGKIFSEVWDKNRGRY